MIPFEQVTPGFYKIQGLIDNEVTECEILEFSKNSHSMRVKYEGKIEWFLCEPFKNFIYKC